MKVFPRTTWSNYARIVTSVYRHEHRLVSRKTNKHENFDYRKEWASFRSSWWVVSSNGVNDVVHVCSSSGVITVRMCAYLDQISKMLWLMFHVLSSQIGEKFVVGMWFSLWAAECAVMTVVISFSLWNKVFLCTGLTNIVLPSFLRSYSCIAEKFTYLNKMTEMRLLYPNFIQTS